MPSVKINFNTILHDDVLDGEKYTVKGFTNCTLTEYYSKYMSFDIGDTYIQSPNDNSLTNDIINSTYWFKFVANDGYKIVRAYSSGSSGISVNKEITDFSDKIYPFVTGTTSPRQDHIFIEVVTDVKPFKFEQNLTNCTSDNNQSTISNGEHVVTITAKNGFYFEEMPTSNMCTFTLNEDRTVATVVMMVIGDTWLTANATKIIKYYNLNQELIDCTSDKGDKIAEGNQKITFIANDGYEFRNIGYWKMGAISHDLSNFSNDLKRAFINTNVNGDMIVRLDASKVTNQVGTFVNLYKTSSNELTALSKVRFFQDLNGVVDYGEFIYSVINLPFNIPDDMLADVGTIMLGRMDSNVNSTLIYGHILNVDIGNIKVDEKYHNAYDYINTQCYLHLPYVDKMEIPVEYVVNHTISIHYVIDLYNGNATVNIVSDFINNVCVSKTFEIGYKIPFIHQSENKLVSELKTVIDNDIKTAFVEVVRNVPYDTTTPFGKPTIDYGRLSDYTGYIEVSNIILNVGASNAEKTEIEMLLKQGVYIREK